MSNPELSSNNETSPDAAAPDSPVEQYDTNYRHSLRQHNSNDSIASNASMPKAAFQMLKSKARYVTSLATNNPSNSYSRNISKLLSASSMAAAPGPPGVNSVIPQASQLSDEEVLVVYPSYCRQTESGLYEVIIKGWLYIPGIPNTKSRMMIATAKKIAGIKSAKPQTARSTQTAETPSVEDEEDGDIVDFKPEHLASAKTDASMDSNASISTQAIQEETLKTRLDPFFTTPITGRQIKFTFSELMDASGERMMIFGSETNSSGRFQARIRLQNRPFVVSIEAHESLVSLEEITYIEPCGISVISDFDDTVKTTGILGPKRELFRNVFVYDYDQIGIEGVQEWYHDLEKAGAQFHYVSNSPWQLYPPILSYLRSSNFPQGSMHLKEYNGFLNGLFEAASERKKQTLHRIVQDFPKRKFILIGDSGEGDLEAYIDVARQFPSQIMALYIRDITLPPDGDINSDYSYFRRNMIPRPDEIDRYDKSAKAGSNSGTRAQNSSLITPSPRPLSESNVLPSPGNPFTAPMFAPKNYSPTTNSKHPFSFININTPYSDPCFVTDDSLDTFYWHPSLDENDIPPPLPHKPSYLRPRRRRPVSTASISIMTSASPSVLASASATAPMSAPSTSTPPAYVLPSGSINPNTTSSSRAPYRRGEYQQKATTDNCELASVLDKKVENWKQRVMSARCELQGGARLRIWKVGHDARDESVEIVKREIEKVRRLTSAPLSQGAVQVAQNVPADQDAVQANQGSVNTKPHGEVGETA